MKAVVITEQRSCVTDVPDPQPSDGEVLIEAHAAGKPR